MPLAALVAVAADPQASVAGDSTDNLEEGTAFLVVDSNPVDIVGSTLVVACWATVVADFVVVDLNPPSVFNLVPSFGSEFNVPEIGIR